MTLLCRGLLGAVCLLVPALAEAQQRFGAVSGTWEACRLALPSAPGLTADDALWNYRARRYVTEADKCLRYRDAPIEAHLDVIERYNSLRLHRRAYELARAALTWFEDAPELHFEAGRALWELAERDAAAEHLSVAVAARPTDVDAAELLGAYYYDKGDVERATPLLRGVAEARPRSFAANASAGDACLSLGDLACASRYLGEASRLRPDDVLLAVRVGDLERRRGNLEGAVEPYSQALQVDPARFAAHVGLGLTLRDLGLLEQAAHHLGQAVRLRPGDGDALTQAARVLRWLGRPLAALAILAPSVSAMQDAPASVVVEQLLALNAAGRAREALGVLERAPRHSEDDRVQAALGDVYLGLGELGLANAAYGRAAALRPQAWEYKARLARVAIAEKRFADAEALLTPFTSHGWVRRALVDALLAAARAHSGAGREQEALACVVRARQIAPEDAAVNQALLALAVAARTPDLVEEAKARLESVPEALQGYEALVAGDLSRAQRVDARTLQGRRVRASALYQAKRFSELRALLQTSAPGADFERDHLLAANAHLFRDGLAMRAADVESFLDLPLAQNTRFEVWMGRAAGVRAGLEGRSFVLSEQDAVADALGRSLRAVAALHAGNVEEALTALGRMDDPVHSRLRAQAELRAAVERGARGEWATAQKVLPRDVSVSAWSSAELVALVTVQLANKPKKLIAALEPYVAQSAVAAFNVAMAYDRIGEPERALGALMAVSSAQAAGMQARLEALRVLKERLYR